MWLLFKDWLSFKFTQAISDLLLMAEGKDPPKRPWIKREF